MAAHAEIPAASPAPAESVAKLAYVDALRGLAILGVVLVHVAQFVPDTSYLGFWPRNLMAQGARGVQLFFLVSAFTLCRSLAARQGERHAIRNFLVRRLFRIAPLYWLGVVFYSIWGVPFTGQPRPASVGSVLANVTFLHGLSPYWINGLVPGGWSIAVEMWFYCLAPWLFGRLRTADLAARFVAGSTLVAIASTALLAHAAPIADATRWQQYLFWWFPSQLPHFALGLLLYRLGAGEPGSRRLRPATWAGLAVAAGAVLLTVRPVGGSLQYVFGAGFLALAWGLRRKAIFLLVNPITVYLGRISFSLYLGHFVVLYALGHWGYARLLPVTDAASALLSIGLRFGLGLGLGVALSAGLHRWVEVPGQQLGARLIRRLGS